MPEEGSISIEQFLLTRLSKSDFKKWVDNSSAPYKELMAYYRCAIMEIETKFKVLNEELSIQYDRNPIETIKSRLKTPESILDKMNRKGFPLTVDSIEQNISDIAGISGNYVWIKADFELPPNLPSDDISLFISYIHFAEKTYLNGELIGECGVFPDANGKGERSAMYRTHFYRLNKNLLNEAGKNTIYIQIYSKGHAESSGYCYIGPTDVLTELSTFNLFWSSRFYLLICASPFITFVLFNCCSNVK